MDNKRGFTFIELIVVVILVSILAGLATTRFVQSFRERRSDYFVKELVAYLRYIQIKAIEEGMTHQLEVDPDSKALKSLSQSSDASEFHEISISMFKRFKKTDPFVVQLEEGNQIYFFPDGNVTPAKLSITEGAEEKASVAIKNRLGVFEVSRHD